jgi:predicted nucleic acid-binding protein
MFLLDTNVISELRRPDKADRNVIAWARTIPAAGLFLSVISILRMRTRVLWGTPTTARAARAAYARRTASYPAVCTPTVS